MYTCITRVCFGSGYLRTKQVTQSSPRKGPLILSFLRGVLERNNIFEQCFLLVVKVDYVTALSVRESLSLSLSDPIHA